jgi:hypothetical protein
MTRAEATAVARDFMRRYVTTGRQWTVNDLAACLPTGYVWSA